MSLPRPIGSWRFSRFFLLAVLLSLLSCNSGSSGGGNSGVVTGGSGSGSGTGTGGAGPDALPGSGAGKVALFITDNISFYKQVITTITGVRLVNSGTGEVCTVLDTPVTLDISNLTNFARYVSVAACPATKYNKIDIDVKPGVILMDEQSSTSACTFASNVLENGDVKPLVCDPATSICTLSIRGGVRDGFTQVQEAQYNDLGIDFDLKQSTVAAFGNPAACSLTVTVIPVSAADMNSSGRAHGAAGTVQSLDTVARTFTLIASGAALTVDYSGINQALQPNIDDLLIKAGSEGFSVQVRTGDIDFAAGRISANRIFMKAAGAATKVLDNPKWSFTLTYGPAKTIAGSHKAPAVVQGAFTDGAWVNVTFDGYDSKNAEFLAATVEVLPQDMVLDD